MKNYYDLLGINQDATQEEIEKRFRFLANAYHPDKFPSQNQKEQAEEEFKIINEAYQIYQTHQKDLHTIIPDFSINIKPLPIIVEMIKNNQTNMAKNRQIMIKT